MVAEALTAYQADMLAARRQALEASVAQRRELEQVERKLAGVVRAIEDGAWSETLRGRLAELEMRRTQLRSAVASRAVPETPEIRLHPGLIDRYRGEVARLEEALQHESIRDEAAELLRRLIARVVLMPAADTPDGLAATLYGDLAVILALGERRRSGGACAGHDRVPRERVFSGGSGSQLSVVAGAGFDRKLPRLRVSC